MAKPYDILLNSDDELQFSTEGDFVLGISEAQNLDHLINTVPGQVKTQPTTGVGMVRYIKKRMNVIGLYGAVKSQLKADKWVNEDLHVNEQEVTINAEREE